MNEEVGGEGGTALETFPTLLTLEQLLSAVNGSEERKYYKTKILCLLPSPVLVQTDLVTEGLVAELTGERSGNNDETNFYIFI